MDNAAIPIRRQKCRLLRGRKMSYYVGFGAKLIVREEFRFLIENGFDFEGSSDLVLMCFDRLEEHELFYTYVQYEKSTFDKESGCWEFRYKYNMNSGIDPFFAVNDLFQRGLFLNIAQELLDAWNYNEYQSFEWSPYGDQLIQSLNSEINDRKQLIENIKRELKSSDSYQNNRFKGVLDEYLP